MAQIKVANYFNSWQQKYFDWLASFLLLIAAAPVMGIISVAILIESGVPIFFIQKRLGLHKKIFTIYKFRSMVKNAPLLQARYSHLNQAPPPMFKIYQDPRFTRVGRFLSQSGLDELPQLINILRGEMSLIGPRPLPVKEGLALDQNWDFRYLVKPGIFSDWTLNPTRHSNLKKWQELEKKTVTKMDLIKETTTIFKTIRFQIPKLISISKPTH